MQPRENEVFQVASSLRVQTRASADGSAKQARSCRSSLQRRGQKSQDSEGQEAHEILLSLCGSGEWKAVHANVRNV